MDQRFLMIKEEMNEKVKKTESSVKQMSGDVKQVNDKVEILENKTEVMDRELKRQLDNLALLKLREK